MVATTLHLLRHGEVHNPTGVLYGRLPGYHLSERGRAQAQATGLRLLHDGADARQPQRCVADLAAQLEYELGYWHVRTRRR